ncbi:hypothetical protein GALMADRAFT_714121 [Galerina marginata CBS 339.88]|uniref:Uncharacterized protein n=1 Tax=Galerina marginata (strain CBS 339.88) TaxID=685588 RepID=A0A067TWZ5_GALM3|nr:hypothetical protein GALMADRAFT_714121 [Galerina marginata CBS 339.88]
MKILSLNPGDIKMLFFDLDFLVDKTRSKNLHIDIPSNRAEHLQTCFQLLSWATREIISSTRGNRMVQYYRYHEEVRCKVTGMMYVRRQS